MNGSIGVFFGLKKRKTFWTLNFFSLNNSMELFNEKKRAELLNFFKVFISARHSHILKNVRMFFWDNSMELFNEEEWAFFITIATPKHLNFVNYPYP